MKITCCDFCEVEIEGRPGLPSPRPVRFNNDDIDLCDKCWWHVYDFFKYKGAVADMGSEDKTNAGS